MPNMKASQGNRRDALDVVRRPPPSLQPRWKQLDVLDADAYYPPRWSGDSSNESGIEMTPRNGAGAREVPAPDQPGFIKGFPLVCLMTGLMITQLLVSIDRTIISTAIPHITHEFHSTPHIGWYGSAYLLTACAFQPLFGKIFMLFSVKKAYLAALFLFEVGSLLCGVAPNSITLIAGRAVAGLGSAGVLAGSFVVVGAAVPLQSRPVLMAVVGTMFGIGATIGPLLGGVFTDLVVCAPSFPLLWSGVVDCRVLIGEQSWRWCFYVNLPVGGATVLAMLLFFHPVENKKAHRGLKERLMDLDLVGNAVLLVASTFSFFALEFVTEGYSWTSTPVFALGLSGLVIGAFFPAWLKIRGDKALLPPRIVLQRTVAASCGMSFMIYGALINLTYFLPIWFQAIRGVTALQSGIDMIPYFIVNAAFSLLAGWFVSKAGYVTPPAVAGCALGTIGLGLMTLLGVGTTTATWVGIQVLTSAGFGTSIQQGFTAVQTVLPQEDMAIATAAVVASQSAGGALFLAVGNSVFQKQLRNAAGGALDGIDVKGLIDSGAASFRQLVPADRLPAILEVYNKAITTVFIVSIPLGGLAAIIACFIQWNSVRKAASRGEEAAEESSDGHDSSHGSGRLGADSDNKPDSDYDSDPEPYEMPVWL